MKNVYYLLFAFSLMAACSSGEKNASETSSTPPGAVASADQNDPKASKGIGPVKSLELGELDEAMAEEGKKIFNRTCTACHKIDEDYIGPSPKGLMDRRSPEWIMNMILNPTEMVQKDPIAMKVLEEYNNAPMANMGLTEEDARKVLEYMRTIN